MKLTAPVARRSPSVTSQLGLSDRIFSTAADRGLAASIETGLDEVTSSLLAELDFAD